MNIKHYKLLNYALILLLVMVPFRSAIASQKQQCHSPEEMVSHSKHATMMMQDVSSFSEMKSHELHLSIKMTAVISKGTDLAQVKSCCCEHDSNCASSCASSCDIGTMVSLVLQQSLYSPVFTDASGTITVSPSILLRELTPPSRPPARLS